LDNANYVRSSPLPFISRTSSPQRSLYPSSVQFRSTLTSLPYQQLRHISLGLVLLLLERVLLMFRTMHLSAAPRQQQPRINQILLLKSAKTNNFSYTPSILLRNMQTNTSIKIRSSANPVNLFSAPQLRMSQPNKLAGTQKRKLQKRQQLQRRRPPRKKLRNVVVQAQPLRPQQLYRKRVAPLQERLVVSSWRRDAVVPYHLVALRN
jgi:hypothetical protein